MATPLLPGWLLEVCERISSRDCTITNLNLNIRRLDPRGMDALATALRRNNDSLKVLNLTTSLANVGVALSDIVIDALVHGSSLRVLHLSYNYIRDVRPLADALRNDTTLEEVHLDHNNIMFGEEELADVVKENSTLKVLNLAWNSHLDEDRLLPIVQNLTFNTTLKKLRLEHTLRCTHHGADVLLSILQRNTVIEDIRVSPATTDPSLEAKVQHARFLGHVNRQGRYLLQKNDVPLAVWPRVLSKADDPSVVYYFLTQKPAGLVGLANNDQTTMLID